MRKRWPILFSALLGVFLAGCISVETTVKLNRDGSGQIVEKIGIKKEMANFASAMSAASGEAQEPKPFSTEQFEKSAGDFGKGVRFVSMTESEGQGMKYYEVAYAFDDINKIGIDQNQGNRVSTPSEQAGQRKEEPIRFVFASGEDYSTLKISLPESHSDGFEESSPDKKAASPEMEESELQMMKMMFQGMRFAVKIDCEGEIVETNATNVDGSTVTLLYVDFDAFLDNTEKLKQLSAKKPEGIEEVKEILKDIEGLKFELQEEVTIRFE